MGRTGLCCGNLEEQKVLMRMGLSMVLLGHVNFLLAALVHGVVLRHFSLQRGQAMESAISNVIALTSGLMGVVIGILVIVLSKNRTSRVLMWSLSVVSAVTGLVAAASVVGLTVSLIKTIIHGDKRLLAYCGYTDDKSHLSISNDCPFDPTRIYGSTIALWVPLIAMCAVQMVFSCRLLPVSISFLGLHNHPHDTSRPTRPPRTAEPPLLLRYAPPFCHYQGDQDQKRPTRSLPHKPCSQFNRGALERSSIWI